MVGDVVTAILCCGDVVAGEEREASNGKEVFRRNRVRKAISSFSITLQKHITFLAIAKNQRPDTPGRYHTYSFFVKATNMVQDYY